MVAIGRPKGDRRSYLQWEEGGRPPDVVFEILTVGRRELTMLEKLRFYERFGVDQERQRADRLADALRAASIDPDSAAPSRPIS